jgi:hypothetical protein
MDEKGQAYWQCGCGYRDYDFNASFCSRCGEKRPVEEDRAAALEDLRESLLEKTEEREQAIKGKKFIG